MLIWNHSDGAILRPGQVLFRRPYLDTGKEQCAGFAGKSPVPKGLPRGGVQVKSLLMKGVVCPATRSPRAFLSHVEPFDGPNPVTRLVTERSAMSVIGQVP